MQWTSEEQQEWFDYIFQHKYYRVEQVSKRLEKNWGQASVNFLAKRGIGLQSECTFPDDDATMEFELTISSFARPDSWYNVDQWLKFLRKVAGENHSSKFNEIETRLQRIREGEIELILNQKKLTDYEAYETIAQRVVFAGDLDADAYEQKVLKDDQTRQLLWKKYHTYCTRLWDFLQEVQGYRNKHRIRPPPIKRENICIYCKETEGDFSHVEHTIPESLGNEYSFLPKGFVCRDCMSKLNNLEDGINEMLPFSLVLVTTHTSNKKGKLPIFKSSSFHIHKKSPNKMVFMPFGKKSNFKDEPVIGGYRISLNVSAPSGHFEAHRVARMLYKAALGEVALALGNDRATVLDPKFDDVRRYIIKGGTFPNKMMFFKKALPEPRMETIWYEVDGVPKVKFVVQGLIFIIVLGERPKLEPHDDLEPHVTMFDLSLDRAEAGINQPNVK